MGLLTLTLLKHLRNEWRRVRLRKQWGQFRRAKQLWRPSNEVNWSKVVNLSVILDATVRNKSLNMLHRYYYMHSGALGLITATEHIILLKQGTRAAHKLTYSQIQALGSVTQKHLQEQIQSWVIEPTKSALAIYELFVPKKGRMIFCIIQETQPCYRRRYVALTSYWRLYWLLGRRWRFIYTGLQLWVSVSTLSWSRS